MIGGLPAQNDVEGVLLIGGPEQREDVARARREKIFLPLIIRAHKSYQLVLISREEAEALTESVG